jgi:hypothetical protein
VGDAGMGVDQRLQPQQLGKHAEGSPGFQHYGLGRRVVDLCHWRGGMAKFTRDRWGCASEGVGAETDQDS